MPQASLSVRACSERLRGAPCAVAAGALVAGGGLGAYMAADDPLTDEPHGRGNATGAYTADDVILSMCNNCNSYCTIKVRVTDAENGNLLAVPVADEGEGS